jgi:hypothetical protein
MYARARVRVKQTKTLKIPPKTNPQMTAPLFTAVIDQATDVESYLAIILHTFYQRVVE